jgi:AraC family transcriptional regulator
MASAYEPISMGSPRFRTVPTFGFWVTEAWFPPNLVLEPHLHERAAVAVMLEGSFNVAFGSRKMQCSPATLHTEPLGEKHANYVGQRGAHVLVLQPDHEQEEVFVPCARLLERVQHLQDATVQGLAWRIAREIRSSDGVTSMAVEGLSLELMAVAARLGAPAARGPIPHWLAQAEELLRERFAAPPTIADVACEVGVHPCHLARAFRARHHMPIGAFVRQLRLEWAARRLVTSDVPLAAVALEAGFADQSHLTRAFKRYSGMPPGQYRRELQGP